MKTGDKLLCKSRLFYDKNIIFRKGEYYEIARSPHRIDDEDVYVFCEKMEQKIRIGWRSINKKEIKIGFTVKGKESYWYLYRYFYTKEEMRKLKLEKINGI